MDPVEVRYASTDKDVIAIHRFLCAISGPARFCPINPLKAVNEINRVVKDNSYGYALIAEINGELVGSLGIIIPDWWYGDTRFSTDRWFFIFPVLNHRGIATSLLAEASAMAVRCGVPLLINGKPRAKNKSSAGGEIHYVKHSLVESDHDEQTAH